MVWPVFVSALVDAGAGPHVRVHLAMFFRIAARQYPLNLAPFEKSCEPLVKELLSHRSIPLPEKIQEAKMVNCWELQKVGSIHLVISWYFGICDAKCKGQKIRQPYNKTREWEGCLRCCIWAQALYKNLLRVLAFSATAALQSSKLDVFGISVDPNFRRWAGRAKPIERRLASALLWSCRDRQFQHCQSHLQCFEVIL